MISRGATIGAAVLWFVVAGQQVASDHGRAGVVALLAGLTFVGVAALQWRERARAKQKD